MAVFLLNNIEVPVPSAINMSKEPLWSSNAGRSTTGLFIGDLVCRKNKLQITWPTLTQEEAALIDSIVTNDFFTVSFVDPAGKTDELTTITAYAGSATYPVYSYASGRKRYKGIGIDLIEQ